MISHRLGKVTAVIPPDRKVDDVDTAETELQVGQCPRQNADRQEAQDTQHMKDVWGTLAKAHDSAFNGHCQVRISESSSHEP